MNLDPTTLSIIIAVGALLIAGYLLYARKTPLTGNNITAALKEGHGTATEIATVIQAAVFAAEQLKATGQLPDNNAAFDYAFTQAQKLLPTLEEETLEMWIESMVPLANQVINRDGVPPQEVKP